MYPRLSWERSFSSCVPSGGPALTSVTHRSKRIISLAQLRATWAGYPFGSRHPEKNQCLHLELHGAFVADCRVSTFSIVEAFDVIEHVKCGTRSSEFWPNFPTGLLSRLTRPGLQLSSRRELRSCALVRSGVAVLSDDSAPWGHHRQVSPDDPENRRAQGGRSNSASGQVLCRINGFGQTCFSLGKLQVAVMNGRCVLTHLPAGRVRRRAGPALLFGVTPYTSVARHATSLPEQQITDFAYLPNGISSAGQALSSASCAQRGRL